VKGVHVDIEFSRRSSDHIAECLHQLWMKGDISQDDMILVTAVGYPNSGNRMNLLQTHAVSDLVEGLGW
jgi:pyruvate kinase